MRIDTVTGPLDDNLIGRDSSVVGYRPATLSNWPGSADPGDVAEALDSLALQSATDVDSIASSDGSLNVSAPTGNVDVTLNTAHANTWSAAQTMGTTTKLQLRDTGIYLHSPADGEALFESDNLLTLRGLSNTVLGVAGHVRFGAAGDATERDVTPGVASKRNLGTSLLPWNNLHCGPINTNGAALNYTLTVIATGTVYALTASQALFNFGTTDPILTVDKAGTYRVLAQVQLRYNAATFAASRTVTMLVRRTNNTAADLANSTRTALTPTLGAATTATFVDLTWEFLYTTANTNDSIELQGLISVVPGAGSLDVTWASLHLVRLS